MRATQTCFTFPQQLRRALAAAVLAAIEACEQPVDLYGLDFDAVPYTYYGSSEEGERQRAHQ